MKQFERVGSNQARAALLLLEARLPTFVSALPIVQ